MNDLKYHPRFAVETLESRRLMSVVGAGTEALSAGMPTKGMITLSASSSVGVTIHAEATDSFSGTVGILKNFVPPPAPLNPTAVGLVETINWGDGTKPSSGKLVSDSTAKEFLIKGSHTYAKAGTFKVIVTVTWGPLPGSDLMIPSTLLATIHSTAIVSKDNDGGVTLSETAGKVFSAAVGSFDFRSVDLVMNATIDWGDGTHSVGKIVGDFASGEYQVFGEHIFAKAGKYSIHVKVLSHVVGAPSTLPSGTVAQWSSAINVCAQA